jgi:hypothetical protein
MIKTLSELGFVGFYDLRIKSENKVIVILNEVKNPV